MKSILLIIATVFVAFSPSIAPAQSVEDWTEANLDSLVKLYFDLHRNPELSYQEKETSKRIADEWERVGYKVTRNFGGFGVVAILENGPGPTVMLRTDLDALPVTEATGLEYASTVKVTNEDGSKTGVMHACGHDIHMTNLVGVARYLAAYRDRWQGTLMLIGQPAEERVGGAKAMLEDGLFTKFPKPDFGLALHVAHDIPAGKVGYRAGYSLANVDSVDITVKGRGGHGSAPHTTVDPIVQAAELVVALQSIVSREVKPLEPAVITVGSIHGGTKHNIIGDECKLQLTVRSYSADVRTQLLEAIERKAKAVAISHRAPAPDLKFSEGTPSLYNDDELAGRLSSVFVQTVGEANVEQVEPVMGAEDFSLYGKAGVPILMYRLGSVSQRRLDQFKMAGQTPPSLHSAAYYPDFELTLRTGIATMTNAALNLLPRR
ncbi:M20 metallopeptidase family protein [Fuerstiella marisgermanici]|uniref:N-acetyldiaminopimelate deacetylase n=1 Tax=Fuerstiella marisgermanici TaxID=1891926 RepID=A0A1P8WSD9_9PLAN|nr:amidohydrolase [Fuerstiella marisgermanici]APZ96974.1 N-acetyldiaminopimelate deacetylase [Fuerstiella marisgermanici]